MVDVIKVEHMPVGMSISHDGTKLWYAGTETADVQHGWVGAVSLDNLTVLPSILLNMPVYYVEQALDDTLYVSSDTQIVHIDASTGQRLGSLAPANGILVLTPDRRTLFAASLVSQTAKGWQCDISHSLGVITEQTDNNTRGEGTVLDLKVSHNGQYLCLADVDGNQYHLPTVATDLIPTADIRAVAGSFVNGSNTWPGAVAFSNDDALLYEGAAGPGDVGAEIQIFDTASFAKAGSISLVERGFTSGPTVGDMVVDSTDAYLFAATNYTGEPGDVRVYRTGRGTPPAATPAPAKILSNISTRAQCLTGSSNLVAGFIIKGSSAKRVIIRAMGPSLVLYGIGDVLWDPIITLYDSRGQTVAINDNWNSDRPNVLATPFPPNNVHEAAIVATLPPGAYTVGLQGVANTTGTALVEVYDLTPAGSALANLSTRGPVSYGDNPMIGGFVVGGSQPTRVVVRALGPTLAQFGVTGALADPTLELHNSNGTLLTYNDDWINSAQQQAIRASGYAPAHSSESVILATLPPGNYTAVVRGKNATTGVALVEVYNLDAN